MGKIGKFMAFDLGTVPVEADEFRRIRLVGPRSRHPPHAQPIPPSPHAHQAVLGGNLHKPHRVSGLVQHHRPLGIAHQRGHRKALPAGAPGGRPAGQRDGQRSGGERNGLACGAIFRLHEEVVLGISQQSEHGH